MFPARLTGCWWKGAFMKVVSAKLILFASCVGSAGVWASGPRDGLVFDLGMDAVEGAAQAGALCDKTTWSAPGGKTTAVRVSTFAGGGEAPEPVSVTNASVILPFLWNATNNQPCLRFAQPTNHLDNGDGTVTTNIFPQSVSFPHAVASSNVTVFIRFRPEYPAQPVYHHVIIDNGSANNRGWKINFRKADQYYFIVNVGGNDNWLNYKAYILDSNASNSEMGFWCDVAFVFETQGNNTLVTPYTCRPGEYVRTGRGNNYYPSVGVSGSSFTITKPIILDKDGNGETTSPLTIGAPASTTNATGWVNLVSGENQGAFKGSIAKLQIFDRAFSADEVRSLFSDASGRAVFVGSVNGRADEFAAADDENVADPFLPATMDCRRMRKELTSAHPALTLKVPFAESDAGLLRVLSVTPLLEDLGSGSAEVRVDVNGSYVGKMDLAAKRDLVIPGKFVTRAADGNVTIAVTRVGDTSGTIGIDAVSLGGSWSVGASAFQISAALWNAGHGFFGTPYGGYLFQTVFGLKDGGPLCYLPASTVSFDVPGFIAERYDSRFTFKCQSADVPNAAMIDWYVNGVKGGSGPIGPMVAGASYSVDFPAGTFTGGLNNVTVSNCTTGKLSAQYPAVGFSAYTFEVFNIPSGTAIFMR